MISMHAVLRDPPGWLGQVCLGLSAWTLVLLVLLVRLAQADSSRSPALFDAVVFLALEASYLYRAWPATAAAASPSSQQLLSAWAGHLVLGALAIAATWLWTTWPVQQQQQQQQPLSSDKAADQQPEACPLRPLLWPCRTTHTRMFPKVHSFGYAYLLVGVPVGWPSTSKLISVDSQHDRAWFHVSAEDHLERDNGSDRKSLRHKLDEYLADQGLDPHGCPLAYLVTAPRFLGYCFNPVSFWYLYSAERRLRAMILEVNNTFDERRMYLLEQSDADADFRSEWAKDFHVSPFNSRKGSYKLVAQDPRPFVDEAPKIVGNDITLMSSQGRPKLVARVFSTRGPVAGAAATVRDATCIAATWGWMGFLTFPRIVKEAGRLYFEHALQVFYRPEVVGTTSIARRASADERTLAEVFGQFLADAVAHSPRPLRVAYSCPAELGRQCTRELQSKAVGSSASSASSGQASSSRQAAGNGASRVVVRVVTPAFYSRMVHHGHLAAALEREGERADERDRTVVVEGSAAGLAALLEAADGLAGVGGGGGGGGKYCRGRSSWAWALVRELRCPPAAASYHDGSGSSGARTAAHAQAAAAPSLSALDVHAAASRLGGRYWRIAVGQFVAQRAGVPVAVVQAAGTALRVGTLVAACTASQQLLLLAAAACSRG